MGQFDLICIQQFGKINRRLARIGRWAGPCLKAYGRNGGLNLWIERRGELIKCIATGENQSCNRSRDRDQAQRPWVLFGQGEIGRGHARLSRLGSHAVLVCLPKRRCSGIIVTKGLRIRERRDRAAGHIIVKPRDRLHPVGPVEPLYPAPSEPNRTNAKTRQRQAVKHRAEALKNTEEYTGKENEKQRPKRPERIRDPLRAKHQSRP